MHELQLLIFTVIVLALLFDFINGFHDTANAIATAVSTRAIHPSYAIMMAAGLNFNAGNTIFLFKNQNVTVKNRAVLTASDKLKRYPFLLSPYFADTDETYADAACHTLFH